jgi:phosphoglycerol transferase MdoB-like AlkP superfamily enzyme
VLFTLGIIIKLFFLHYYIGISEGIILITLINFITIISIYCLVSFFFGKRDMKITFILNMVLTILFFIDTMYYSHFFTLIPTHSVLQIGQLGPVSDSIFSLIRPGYFLMFTDTVLLWRLYIKNKNQTSKIKIEVKKTKLIFLLAFFLLSCITTGSTYQTIKSTEGIYTPQNLGIINYHLLDAMDLFYKSSLDKKMAEEVIETIVEGEGENRGFEVAKDKNVIVIQAESLQNFVINQKIEGQMITPVLNELIKNDSIYFKRYYEQVGWGNTSDAEFITHNSYYPSIKNFSYMAYKDNEFTTLPSLLKEQGYSTIAFHGNKADFWNRDKMYPSQGLDTFISLEDFEQDEMMGIGLSDGSMFRQSINKLKEQKQPFYGFFITLTSHHPFIMEDEYKGLNIEGEFKDTLLEDYLQSIHYLDQELGKFIDMLKEEGLYEDTMIAIYGDHEGLDMRDEEAQELLSSFLEKSYREDEMRRVPLITHIPNSNYHEVVSTTGGQIDFFPTIGNLLGLEVDPGKVLGKDIFNIKDGFVAKQVHVARGSFIDNEKVFIMSEDGIFENSEAWDIETGEPIDVEECREGYERALGEVNLSEYILQNNLIPEVREKGLEYVIENRVEE